MGENTTTAHVKFAIFMLLWQALNIILYGVKGKYASEADPQNDAISAPMSIQYAFFQDVHVMIFVGFGFLMTFLHKYSYGAVGYNFVIAAMSLQWAVLVISFWHHLHDKTLKHGHVEVSLYALVNADFAAGAVLITFGGVLGKTNVFQLLTITIIEVVCYGLNEMILTKKLVVADIGGSMVIHVFGAYFGLSCAWVLGPHSTDPPPSQHKDNRSNKSFDTMAMIGTLFLFLFWPSFNAAVATGPRQHRAVVNTVLSIVGSVGMAFAVSAVAKRHQHHTNLFSMVDVQNATLAGGVACGAIADLSINPWGALLTGCCTGLLSCVGFNYFQSFLAHQVRLFDTCGIHNLHAMPGVIGGFAGAIAAAIATHSDYGAALYVLYPMRAPADPIAAAALGVATGLGRSGYDQAIAQLKGLGVSVGIAIAAGTLTGLLIKLPFFEPSSTTKDMFNDALYWEIPGEEHEPLGAETEVEVTSDNQGNNGNSESARNNGNNGRGAIAPPRAVDRQQSSGQATNNKQQNVHARAFLV
eukprot:c11628_g1_i2.p1 GENE.c11628_g1_i2~~c11628_g1_i2.p1  ORF type:complete len:526 (-),score=125.11 c11628_g1_i2:248-1825(-)